MLEATRCYTEVLQMAKPRPEKRHIEGPLWRLPGPSFGKTQRSNGHSMCPSIWQFIPKCQRPHCLQPGAFNLLQGPSIAAWNTCFL